MRLAKWGNSLALRIPRPLADQVRLHLDDEVEIKVEGESLIVRRRLEAPALGELVAGITEDNRHDAVEWGPARGREAW